MRVEVRYIRLLALENLFSVEATAARSALNPCPGSRTRERVGPRSRPCVRRRISSRSGAQALKFENTEAIESRRFLPARHETAHRVRALAGRVLRYAVATRWIEKFLYYSRLLQTARRRRAPPREAAEQGVKGWGRNLKPHAGR